MGGGGKNLLREGNEKTNAALRECGKDEEKKKAAVDQGMSRQGCQHNLWGAGTLLMNGLERQHRVQVNSILFRPFLSV